MRVNWETVELTIAELKVYDYNPRSVSKKAFNQLVRSIKEDGYHQRIIVDADNRIVGGHARRNALLKAGYQPTQTIEVLRADRLLSDEEFKRINIRDNLEYGDWDFEILANEFEIDHLIDWGMDESLFPKIEMIDEVTEADDIVETNVETRCKPGDVWILGNHRLMCGDSTNSDHVDRLMDGNKPDLIYADPPYGISVSTHKGKSLKKFVNGAIAEKKEYAPIIGDNDTKIARDVFDLTINMFDCVIVYWGANYYDFLQPSKCWLVWYKREGLKENSFCGAELAYTNSNKHSRVFPVQWNGIVREGEQNKAVDLYLHPAQKPIKLALDIFYYLEAGKTIYDPFGGSGTTLIACEKSNRNCLMMELSPNYCDIIINRWEKQTGQIARLCDE